MDSPIATGRRSHLHYALAMVLVTVVAAFACGSDPVTVSPTPAACASGPSVACVGAGGCAGTAPCVDAGTYGACTCALVDAASPDVVVPLDAPSEGATPTQTWGKNLGLGTLNAVAVDPSKNVVVAGFTGGLGQMTKMDAGGSVIWDKTVGSGSVNGAHQFTALAIDGAGSIYATGSNLNPGDLGGGPVGPGAFVVKYSAAGAFQWVYGPFASTDFHRIAIKPNGNVVIAGAFFATSDFGGGSVTSKGGSDILLLELSPAKAFVRAKTWGDAGTQTVNALALDATGNVFLTGIFDGQLDFGGGPLSGPATGSGQKNVYVAKVDPDGGYLHQVETKTAASDSRIDALATTPTGAVYLGATLMASSVMNLGGGDLVSAGSYDAVFGMLDANLGHVWSKRFGDNFSQGSVGVATDPSGAAVFTGGYAGTLDFGFGSLPSPDGMFLARFDATGKALAAFGSGSGTTSNAYPRGIAFLDGPDSVVIGRFFGPMKVPSGTLTTAAQGSSFLLRLAP